MIGLKATLITAAVSVAIIGGLLWQNERLAKKVTTERQRAVTAESGWAAERASRAHERKISEDASNDYQTRLQALQTAKSDTPVRTVRLCRSPTGYVPAPSTATGGTDAAGSPGHAGETGQDPQGSGSSADIGPPLYALADEKDEALAQCLSLQKWVRSR